MEKKIKSYPAPWNLSGHGYIFLYKFSKDFIKNNAFVPEFLEGKYCGGFGSVMLVDYQKSNVGPYGELLFIPGKFKYNDKKYDTISKIYVSSEESVVNGRANWGIPKNRADFEFEEIASNKERINISIDDELVGEITIKYSKLKFPVSTKLLPFPLVQKWEDKIYYTNFFGKGKGVLGKIEDIRINSKLFPDVSKCRPIGVIRVDPFAITFPKAVIE